MSGPITPHIEVSVHRDGVLLKLKHAEIVIPPDMADSVADLLHQRASESRDLNLPPTPLPVVTPKKDPIR